MTAVLALPKVSGYTPLEWYDIVRIVESRRASQGPIIQMMIAVRDRYQADYVIPDPSGASDDTSPILTPALIAQAIDQPALRAASVLPNVFVPALDPTKPTGQKSVQFAQARRGAVLYSWYESKLPLLLRRAFRQIRAYNTTCFIVEPEPKTKTAMVRLRDPLTAYPEPKVPEDLTLPCNAGFVHGKSSDWIRARYPKARKENGGPVPMPNHDMYDDLWDVLEWVDENEFVIGLLGPRYRERWDRARGPEPVTSDMELDRYPNRAGCCPVICPQTVSLDQVSSQVAKIIGQTDLQGQLLALEIAAAQRAIFPDRYIIGDSNASPQIVSGNWKEGRSGEVNIILGANSIGELHGDPGQEVGNIQDRLERNARVTSGLTPAMSGEAGGTVPRTGRGLDTLGAWSVDPGVQEIQELMGYALEAINKAIINTYTGYWGAKKYNVPHGLGGSGTFVQFTPEKELAENDYTRVSYAIAGADRQGTTVALGQMVGAELISHFSARMRHPDIDDAEEEGRRIAVEKMVSALETNVLQRAAAPDSPGAIAPEDHAKIIKYIREGQTIDAAVIQVGKERQNTQAATAAGTPPEPGEAAPPGQPGAGAMPGLAGPSEGAGTFVPPPGIAGQGGIEGPSGAQDRLRLLTRALRTQGH